MELGLEHLDTFRRGRELGQSQASKAPEEEAFREHLEDTSIAQLMIHDEN